MSPTLTRILIIVAMTVGTMITRFLVFLLFPSGKKVPAFMEFLGTALPFATVGLLVVYCLKEVNLVAAPHGLPEAIAIVLITVLQWKWGKTLISIAAGTLCYMCLVQFVF